MVMTMNNKSVGLWIVFGLAIVIIFILIGLIARAASKDKTNGNLMVFIGILFGGGTFYVMSKKTPPPTTQL